MRHSKESYLLSLSNGLERASFYGVRALMVLYMISETIGMSTTSALSVYGVYTLGFYFSKIIGALIGDLFLGNKRALKIGGIIQAIGCFAICIPNITSLYTGMVLIVLGSGLYSTNIIAQFGKEYISKPKLIDAGFSIYYTFINIGAFIGVLLIGLIGEIDFSYGFFLGGTLMLLSVFFSYLAKRDNSSKIFKSGTKKIGYKILFVFTVILLSGIFWSVYEITYFGIYETQMRIAENTEKVTEMFLTNSLTSYLSIGITALLALIWSYIYTNQFFKIFIGLLITVLAFILLSTITKNQTDSNLTSLLIFMLLLSLGESLISPMLYSVSTKYANPKYLAIILSLVTVPIMALNKISGYIGEKSIDINYSTILKSCISVCVIITIIALIFSLIENKKLPSK